jgi:hypothetical protein
VNLNNRESDEAKSKLDNLLHRIFGLSPSYYGFLGGALISASINLYTSIVLTEVLSDRYPWILLGSILLFFSAIFSSAISWNLESINRTILYKPRNIEQIQNDWERLFEKSRKRLVTHLMCGVISAVTGLALLRIP